MSTTFWIRDQTNNTFNIDEILTDLINLDPIAIGTLIQPNNQSKSAIALGNYAGSQNQGTCAIALGKYAGYTNQNNNSIAIGSYSGYTNQNEHSIAIGSYSGQNEQKKYSIAIGCSAGQSNQGTYSIAIGKYAGAINQHANTIVLNASGNVLNSSSTNSLYIRPIRGPQTFANALYFNTTTGEVTYGTAGGGGGSGLPPGSEWSEYIFWNTFSSSWEIAGGSADNNRIHLGRNAGFINQGTNALAIGVGAGQTNQGTNAIAIGAGAGATNQHANSIILNASGSALNSGTASAFYVSPVRGPQTFSNTLYFNTSTNEITYGPNVTNIPTANQWSEYLFWNTNTSSWGVGGGSSDLDRIHLGQNAGQNNQGTNAIAIGAGAGTTNQHANSIILNASGSILNSGTASAFYVSPVRGPQTFSNTLYFNTSTNEITYGPNVTSVSNGSQWSEYLFWNTNTTSWSVGGGSLDLDRIHLGQNAGQNGQSANAIAIGKNSGQITQGTNAIAIGAGAGQTNQGTNAIAIGAGAGATNQHANSIILNASGSILNSGSVNSFHVSPVRGPQTFSNTLYFNTSTNEITYGPNATNIPTAAQWSEYLFWNSNTTSWSMGGGSTDLNRIHLGQSAGQNGQNTGAIAIGYQAGQNTQGTNAIAIGVSAGQTNQGTNAIAIGEGAGATNQHANSIVLNASGTALGASTTGFFVNPVRGPLTFSNTLYFNTTTNEITYGPNATNIPTATQWSEYLFWNTNTSSWSVGGGSLDLNRIHLGHSAGQNNQGTNTIAIGAGAGQNNQGTNAIAIGAGAGATNQHSNSIILNASGGNLNSGTASAFYVSPVRGPQTFSNTLYFNTLTNEITYGPNVTSVSNGSQWSEYLFWNTNTSSWGVGGGSTDLDRIHLGQNAGATNQGTNAIAIGVGAGQTNQGTNAIAIGAGAGATNQHANSIILNASGSPLNSGTASAFYVSPVRGPQTFSNTLYFNTLTNEITYGPNVTSVSNGSQWSEYLFWNTSTSSWGVGGGSTDLERIHLGVNAGLTNQGSFGVALGSNAGYTSQRQFAVAVGNTAGYANQGTNAIAIGAGAGQQNQTNNAISIGKEAGQNNQKVGAISMGFESGRFEQGVNSVAIGYQAGSIYQSNNAVAIGVIAGTSTQGLDAVAVGPAAGYNSQGTYAVALGSNSGYVGQNQFAVAVGNTAGYNNQGTNAIAIGAAAGQQNQPANSIILNATGGVFNASTSGFFVNPVRAGLTGTGLVLASGNEIGQTTSSLRYKENISDLQKDTSNIFHLRARSFDLKSGAKNRFGYIAEEVFEIDRSLVILNSENQPEALEEFHMFVCLVEEVKKLKLELNKEKDKSYANLISTNTIQLSTEISKINFTQMSVSNHISYEGSKIFFENQGIYKISTHFYVDDNSGFTAFSKNGNVIEYSIKSIKNTQVYNETIIQIDDPMVDYIELVAYLANSDVVVIHPKVFLTITQI